MTKRTLTPEERLRLRPTVDVDALEALLNHLEPGDRMIVIDACVLHPGAVVIGISQEMAELMASASRYGPPSRISRSDDAIAFDSAELSALWDAVERPTSGEEL